MLYTYSVMTESVLYRKYRPQSLREVLGQDHVVHALEGAIKLGRVSHAYLFAGSRGTGKTSMARILARALGTSETDLYEIGAASHRQIEYIRQLRDAVAAIPFESRYKVYILDEAHMLTPPAWNAFLKTLEEPPAHVVFILATTELEKVPETILSRCDIHHFKKPARETLREASERIAKKEGFAIDRSAAELIALLSEGSFRDAQGILQKVFGASPDKKITVSEVESVTGAPKGELVNAVIGALAEKNADAGLSALARAAEANADMKVFAKLLLERLRFILLLRNAPEMEKGIREEVSAEDFEFLKKIALQKDSRVNSSALLEFLTAYDRIGSASLPQLPLELAVIKLTHTE